MNKLPAIFLTAVIFLFSCIDQKSSAQTGEDKASIISMVNQYSVAFKNKDWTLVTDFIHPEIFNYVSKKNFAKLLDGALREDGYIIEVKGSQIDSIHPLMEFKGDKFALVKMTTTISMMPADNNGTVKKPDEGIPEDFCELLKEADDKYSTLISCRLTGDALEYTMADLSYAIFLVKKGKWFFLSKDEDSEKIVNKIIPEEVRRHFGY